jgi:hypothetical protein
MAYAKRIKPGEYTMTTPSSPGFSITFCIRGDSTFHANLGPGADGHWVNVPGPGSRIIAHLAADQSVGGFNLTYVFTVQGSNNSQMTQWDRGNGIISGFSDAVFTRVGDTCSAAAKSSGSAKRRPLGR